MPYATVDQFVETVTETEARALAPAATGYDDVRIQGAIDDASAELDTYFAAKYSTPVTPVPRTVTTATIALAREALDRTGRDIVKTAAARVRAWAKDVARGVAVLGGGELGTDVPAADAGAGVQFSSPDRVFGDDSLASYLRGA